ncbi:LPS-assembly protein LptD [Yoonia litorea]|uniref:LPS-assembly protein LptD n=1 Tax=Yoonia litorea TaxID=1123755 RepID=A0A1I6LZY9_9RHOB|nr:LPS assembly protein LptD [Yoonia litorea]SFS09010.1 LPS-assembly protein [Yoonia litorea]
MRWLAFLIVLIWPTFGFSQSAANLIADSVRLTADGRLVAEGNVEAFYGDTRLTASRVVYDPETDRLRLDGPIVIRAEDGTILTANQADIDPTLENGILQGARIVLDQQLQIVANQLDRQEGRFSQLYKTSATSCRVCGDRPPLWEIRAERVIHDDISRQLYFQNASFLIRGVPVIWLPRMRLPDPTLSRATGLLVPQQRNTNRLGFGLKLPYFITLGDSRDLTLTPYISPETRTLEWRYRQAFRNGFLRAEGAFSDDTLFDGTRAYLFAEGDFALSGGYQLAFDIESTSDAGYLSAYNYSEKDRLDSAISLTKVTDDQLFQTRLTFFETLRDDESRASLPPIVADLSYTGRKAGPDGSVFVYEAGLDAAYRTSNVAGDAGRDLLRAGGYAGWQKDWVLRNGMLITATTGARADVFAVADDPAFESVALRFVPSANLTLRWPLIQNSAGGTVQIIEPVAQLAWAESFGDRPPNEDSTRTELDRANLLALSRFAGEDAVQTGVQAAAGLVWSRYGAKGLDTTLTVGRILRQEADDRFTPSSGLEEAQSDWLIAGQIVAEGGFLFDARSLWDDDDGLNVADSRITWRNDWITLGANYIWQGPDASENRPDTISEWTVDSAFALSDAWTVDLDARYDIAADRPVSAGIGLEWRNECVTIDVSASRRFASSDTIAPTTTFGISGSIGGFSTGRAAGGLTTGCGN